MKLYIFRSNAANELRAFAGDIEGSKLPEQFRPWQAIGVGDGVMAVQVVLRTGRGKRSAGAGAGPRACASRRFSGRNWSQ